MLLSCVFVEAQTKMSSSSRENAKTSLSLALIAAKLHLHTSKLWYNSLIGGCKGPAFCMGERRS